MDNDLSERIKTFMQGLAYFEYNGSPIKTYERLREVMNQFQNDAYKLYNEIIEQEKRNDPRK